MDVKMKIKLESDESSILKSMFIDDIKDSLSEMNNYPILKYSNYKHHAEIYDISVSENGQETSLLKLFENYSIILTTEAKKIKIFITEKRETPISYNKIEGFLSDFRLFLKKTFHLGKDVWRKSFFMIDPLIYFAKI